MTYDEWLTNVPATMKAEPVWKFAAYRKALFMCELVWADTDGWLKDTRARTHAQQIVASVGSISANIEEGHGRGYGRQMLQFYGYALASARESKGWFFRSRRLLPNDTLTQRLQLCDEIIALLVDELNRQRRRLPPR